jgi:hypothetical protein
VDRDLAVLGRSRQLGKYSAILGGEFDIVGFDHRGEISILFALLYLLILSLLLAPASGWAFNSPGSLLGDPRRTWKRETSLLGLFVWYSPGSDVCVYVSS